MSQEVDQVAREFSNLMLDSTSNVRTRQLLEWLARLFTAAAKVGVVEAQLLIPFAPGIAQRISQAYMGKLPAVTMPPAPGMKPFDGAQDLWLIALSVEAFNLTADRNRVVSFYSFLAAAISQYLIANPS